MNTNENVIICSNCGSIIAQTSRFIPFDFVYCPTCARQSGLKTTMQLDNPAMRIHKNYEKQTYFP